MAKKPQTISKPVRATRARAPAQEPERPYHHGALREAMLEGAERLLARDGIDGLTLRAAAREAGASHAAPKNHFDNVAGLLSELAAVGFERFRRCLLDAAATVDTADAKLSALGRAYVEFATRYPGLFVLMFRSERLDLDRPNLRKAMMAASAVLRDAVGVRSDVHETLHTDDAARLVTAWSMVHGFAMLKIDGRLDAIAASLPGDQDAMSLLDVILEAGGGRLPGLASRNGINEPRS